MAADGSSSGIPEGGSFEEVGSPDELGNGAYFWVYLSPQNNTAELVKDWTVTLKQGDWTGSISSHDPSPTLKTDGLSGDFDVTVAWAQPPKEVVVDLKPLPDSRPNIGCNDNCASMIGIVANEAGNDANYWTTWDAFCK